MQPRLPIVQCPRFELAGQVSELKSSKKVGKLGTAVGMPPVTSSPPSPDSRTRVPCVSTKFAKCMVAAFAYRPLPGMTSEGITINHRFAYSGRCDVDMTTGSITLLLLSSKNKPVHSSAVRKLCSRRRYRGVALHRCPSRESCQPCIRWKKNSIPRLSSAKTGTCERSLRATERSRVLGTLPRIPRRSGTGPFSWDRKSQ